MALPQISLVGTVVAEPELRFTPNGKAVVNFRVACNDRRRNAQGQWEDAGATFLSVSAWDQMAENVVETLHQGDPVSVEGRLSQREYETREGGRRTVFEVTASTVSVPLNRYGAQINRVQRAAPPQQQPQHQGQQQYPQQQQQYPQGQQQFPQQPPQPPQAPPQDPWQNQSDQPPW